MSEVKVTREHRVQALLALDYAEWTPGSPAAVWCERGGDTLECPHPNGLISIMNMVEEAGVALSIATAEHRVRAAVIADLRGLVERSHGNADDGHCVSVDSIELLIETYEEQQ